MTKEWQSLICVHLLSWTTVPSNWWVESKCWWTQWTLTQEHSLSQTLNSYETAQTQLRNSTDHSHLDHSGSTLWRTNRVWEPFRHLWTEPIVCHSTMDKQQHTISQTDSNIDERSIWDWHLDLNEYWVDRAISCLESQSLHTATWTHRLSHC